MKVSEFRSVREITEAIAVLFPNPDARKVFKWGFWLAAVGGALLPTIILTLIAIPMVTAGMVLMLLSMLIARRSQKPETPSEKAQEDASS